MADVSRSVCNLLIHLHQMFVFVPAHDHICSYFYLFINIPDADRDLNKFSVPVFLFLLIAFNEISLKSLFPLDINIVAWKSSDCDYRSTGPLTSHESIRPYPLVGSFTNLSQLGYIHSRFDHWPQLLWPPSTEDDFQCNDTLVARCKHCWKHDKSTFCF